MEDIVTPSFFKSDKLEGLETQQIIFPDVSGGMVLLVTHNILSAVFVYRDRTLEQGHRDTKLCLTDETWTETIIFLRVPASHLFRLRSVSKLWYSLISDPHFAELHFHHSPASTNALFCIKNGNVAYFVYLDALVFNDGNDASHVKEVCTPFKTKPPSHFEVLGSCRGFVLLHRHPQCLVVWNPLTGSTRRISYSGIDSRMYNGFRLPKSARLYGFGYDASRDDYLVVVAWCERRRQDHLDCLSLRTNSWHHLDAALPKPLRVFKDTSTGLFLNGAIHWVPWPIKDHRDAILIFDMKSRTFSTMSEPEPAFSYESYPGIVLLGGCLALYYDCLDSCSTDIWVMKEYKVHSSWTRVFTIVKPILKIKSVVNYQR
ncbi:F-box protein CPR1-like [Arachis stenosperma]|uniref:F-box protein CPR1-like n=1 Tax=Arachis stenosperma TaxID=217475 RepID=UPI0025AD100C|nr:F-box protein CPR1-like [Arachis stenosperma]